MAFDGYLAMTAAEIRRCAALPERLAYMACHYSPYGLGLSNLPEKLPPGSLLILNDRTPICRHDPELAARQLADVVQRFSCAGVLLDLQRTGSEAVVKAVSGTLSCPVCVTPDYAPYTDGPILLPPVPPDTRPEVWFAPYRDRELWLEAALSAMTVTVAAGGAVCGDLTCWEAPSDAQADAGLFCHYRIKLVEDAVVFTLFRTESDLSALLEKAASLGITQMIGLYQELAPSLN